MKKIYLILISLLLINPCLFAFNKKGHRIIGRIAQMNLTKSSKIKIKQLLNNKTLDEVSNWPDEIKSDALLSRPQNTWHYVNVLDGKYQNLNSDNTYEKYFKKYPKMTYEDIQKKIKPDYKNLKGNVIWGIRTFRKVLRNKKKTNKQRAEAVKFLSHFVGDLHQPLHCGYAHDRGGNDVKVDWWGKQTNLHSVWDTDIIEMKNLSFTEYVDYIYKKDSRRNKKYLKGNLLDWMQESIMVRDSLYELVKKKRYQGKYKEYRYHYDFVKLLDTNLVKAGIRLAKILNEDL